MGCSLVIDSLNARIKTPGMVPFTEENRQHVGLACESSHSLLITKSRHHMHSLSACVPVVAEDV